jgi:Helix-turn-helix domain
MDERLKFIVRLLDGEKMAALCRDFGISRKTGYKILTRYNQTGLEGLTDRSRRPYRHAPLHDRTVTVTTCGRTCFNRQKINLSTVFAGQKVGIKQISEEIWLVTFMDYDLGYFDDETCRLEPLANPFGAKVLPMSRE